MLQQAAGAAALPSASREQFLSLSEIGRRLGGDVPTGGAVLDLALYELRVFSQNGEDGVLAEIIRRTGAPGRSFVEFGAFDGVENNCALLADVLGWGGLYIEAGDERFAQLQQKYRPNARVVTVQSMVTPANVEALFAEHGVGPEPDVLSIDVDGGDYWIWEAIARLPAADRRDRVQQRARARPPARAAAHAPWLGRDDLLRCVDRRARCARRRGRATGSSTATSAAATCSIVRDDLPGDYPAVTEVVRRSSNFWLLGIGHRPDKLDREFVDLDA